jgi:hypothetical protein
MLRLKNVRQKSLLLLVAGILVLSVGFVFISCGKDPQLKISDSNKGPFAIDFSLAPGIVGVFYSANDEFPSIAGKELTVEAWVKSKTSSLSGSIFGRYDGNGIVLFVNNNEPKAGIFRPPVTPESTSCSQINATSTECIVDSNASLAQDVWTHIAGVLTSEDQTSGPADCTVAGAENPHLAVYVNGELQNCSSTGSLYAGNPTSKILAIGLPGETGPAIDNGEITGGINFEGVIDEVRIWTVARTQAQIQTCMGQELSFTVRGNCYVDPSILKGYWRLNEGEGDLSADISGGGGSGGFESPGLVPWAGGWVQGAPINRDPG